MFKKTLALAMTALMVFAFVAGCKGSDDDIKVGMVTNPGTIDDKSFNQGTWEGIQKAEKDLGISAKYLKPATAEETSYLAEIANLYDAGYRTIVTSGFQFSSTIIIAQDKYPQCTFIATDLASEEFSKNTVGISYSEHQAGFLAGVAAALELNSGEFGGIYGVAVSSVQRYNWGFQQGVAYANANLGTTVSVKEENLVYVGSFDAAAEGQQLAAQMYDRGVTCIFIAAGKTGTGALTEAKARRANGDDVWAVGVDVDQYDAGKYDGDKSVILTSAVKCVDISVYDQIKLVVDGKFEGGKTLIYDASNNGVGIPKENPNLSQTTQDKVAELFESIKNGDHAVIDTYTEGCGFFE